MNLKILITAISTFLLISNLALALPAQPNAFYGTVILNGNPAPDGTTVTAEINGMEVASTTTSGGKYGDPIGSFYVDDPNADRSGEEISFFVNGANTGQIAFFANGAVTNIDLTATVETTSDSGGDGGGGGGGNGGGGTGGSEATATTVPGAPTTTVCRERWTCTEWSACEKGIQTRTCTEENNCGTDLYKPFESQPCTTVEVEAEGEALSITGLLSLIPSQAIIGFVALTLIFVIFFGWRKVFRKKTTSGMNELL